MMEAGSLRDVVKWFSGCSRRTDADGNNLHLVAHETGKINLLNRVEVVETRSASAPRSCGVSRKVFRIRSWYRRQHGVRDFETASVFVAQALSPGTAWPCQVDGSVPGGSCRRLVEGGACRCVGSWHSGGRDREWPTHDRDRNVDVAALLQIIRGLDTLG